MKGTRRSAKREKLQAVQQVQPKKVSVEETLAKIRRRPSAKWTCNTDSKSPSMLSYELYNRIHSGYENRVIRSLDSSPLLDFNQIGSTRLKIHHLGDSVRIACDEENLFGKDVVYIRDEHAGLLFLDKTDKTFLHLENDQLPGHRLTGKMDIEMSEAGKTEYEGKTVNLVELRVVKPEKLNIRLWCLDTDDMKPFSAAVFGMVLGCPEKLDACQVPIRKLMKLGIPIKGEVRDYQSEELISDFFLQDVKVQDADTGLFDIPKKYQDLRDINAKNGKHAYQPAARASTFRRGGKAPASNQQKDSFQDEARGVGEHKSTGAAAYSLSAMTENRLDPVCGCLPATYGSQVASEFEQQLADDLRFVVNQISSRLSGFSGTGGNLRIDWLDQFKDFSDGLTDGDGLYCLLRDEPDPVSTDPEEQLGGNGLLDAQIERMARALLVNSSASDITSVPVPAGSFSLAGQLILPAPLAASISGILSDTAIDPGDRYDSLAADDQRDYRELYLTQKIGSVDLNYPASTGTQTIFHDLLKFRVDNIEFDIRIDNSEVIETFTVGNNSIHLLVRLPNASGSAFTTRWPSTLYWVVLGVSGIGCLFVPALCALLPFVAAVGAFLLLDAAFVSIEFSDIEADINIDFAPDANGVLQPNTVFTLDMDTSVFYASVIPTGIHQILSAIYSIVGSHTDLILNLIESQLNSKVNDFVQNDLRLTYPPQFGPVPLVGLSSFAGGIDEDHLYLEAELNAGLLGIINPYITQVDTDINARLLDYRTEFQSADATRSLRHYKGFVLSQNFINHFIHILWRLGEYNYVLGVDETRKVMETLRERLPDLGEYEHVHAHICPVVSPRLVLTPCGVERESSYMTCFFDDIRLCLATGRGKKERCILELQLAAKVTAELGFGGLNQETGQLDIIKITDRFMDIYFHNSDIAVQVIHPETQGYADIGKCFDAFNCEHLASLQPLLREAVFWMLQSRDARAIPRDDDDTILQQTYRFSGQFFKFVFWVHRGNLYAHVGFGGSSLMLFPGGVFPIDDLDCPTAQTLLELAEALGG